MLTYVGLRGVLQGSLIAVNMLFGMADRRDLTFKRALWHAIMAVLCVIVVTRHKVATWEGVVLHCDSSSPTWLQHTTNPHHIGSAEPNRHSSSHTAGLHVEAAMQCDNTARIGTLGGSFCQLALYEKYLYIWRAPSVIRAFESSVEAQHLHMLEHPSWFVGLPVLNLLWSIITLVVVLVRKQNRIIHQEAPVDVDACAAGTTSRKASATSGNGSVSPSPPQSLLCKSALPEGFAMAHCWIKAAFVPVWLCFIIISALCHPVPSSLLPMTIMWRASASCGHNLATAVALSHLLSTVSSWLSTT